MTFRGGERKIRNFFLILAAVIFAIGILGTSVMRTTAQTSPKFKVAPLVNTPTPMVTPTPTLVDYYLPYPGILPDHFLYPLKMVRDRILLFLTVDSLKKADLLLLFADKRLGAGRALVEGGKIDLGVSTLTKAEKYLEQALTQAQEAQESGKDTAVFYEKLTKSALKHGEVLQGLSTQVSEEARAVIDQMGNYSLRVYEAVPKTE